MKHVSCTAEPEQETTNASQIRIWDVPLPEACELEYVRFRCSSLSTEWGEQEHASVGMNLWYHATRVLCETLRRQPEFVKDCRVAELGCGCGVAGIFCAALGAKHVLFTDRDEQSLDLCAQNVALNSTVLWPSGAGTSIKQFSLGAKERPQELALAEVVVACDVCYDPPHPKLLIDTIQQHCQSAKTFLVSTLVRPQKIGATGDALLDELLTGLELAGWTAEQQEVMSFAVPLTPEAFVRFEDELPPCEAKFVRLTR
eukprot:TRINITY_DN39399_c0_g1_i1.p1 TRINITY_DN39399_c0_g1~~TRINITY_DN39399_c0_g1_i1.p1  ORF type:complete len:257 (-),score=32.34 TRINITY_DN39399_c0_g1_i1:83-853(-)